MFDYVCTSGTPWFCVVLFMATKDKRKPTARIMHVLLSCTSHFFGTPCLTEFAPLGGKNRTGTGQEQDRNRTGTGQEQEQQQEQEQEQEQQQQQQQQQQEREITPTLALSHFTPTKHLSIGIFQLNTLWHRLRGVTNRSPYRPKYDTISTMSDAVIWTSSEGSDFIIYRRRKHRTVLYLVGPWCSSPCRNRLASCHAGVLLTGGVSDQ